jgi:hypothetical protein
MLILYRDEKLNIVSAKEKVRALIANSSKKNPSIPLLRSKNTFQEKSFIT